MKYYFEIEIDNDKLTIDEIKKELEYLFFNSNSNFSKVKIKKGDSKSFKQALASG